MLYGTYSAMALCDKSSKSLGSNKCLSFKPNDALQAFKKTLMLSWKYITDDQIISSIHKHAGPNTK